MPDPWGDEIRPLLCPLCGLPLGVNGFTQEAQCPRGHAWDRPHIERYVLDQLCGQGKGRFYNRSEN